MISHDQAKELHELLSGGPVPREDLERARELAALVVADTEPHPADNVSYAPCITGKVEIEGRVSEFLVSLDPESSTQYSQWGADNTVLWPRTDLLEKMAEVAREWVLDYPENDEDDDEDEPEASTCKVCHESITWDGKEWVHSDGDKYCGTGDGAMALPEDDDNDD